MSIFFTQNRCFFLHLKLLLKNLCMKRHLLIIRRQFLCFLFLSDTHSGFGAQYCSACPVGFTCDDPMMELVPCSAGTYWTNADGVCVSF